MCKGKARMKKLQKSANGGAVEVCHELTAE